METPETDRAAARPPRRRPSFARAALLSSLPILLVAIGCAGAGSTTRASAPAPPAVATAATTPAAASAATPSPATSTAISATIDDAERAALAERARAELLHAWRAYERLAWG